MNKWTKRDLGVEIADAVALAHRTQTGRGPERVRVDIINDIVLIRRSGVLNAMESRLAATSEGQRLVKNSHRELDEISRVERNAVISAIVGCKVIRSYDDVDVDAEEEVSVLVLEWDVEALLLKRQLDAVSASAHSETSRPR